MRKTLALLAGILVAPVALAGPLDGFGWFGGLAGSCWTGQFPDGTTQHTQCYTTQFGHFLRGTATLASQQDGVLKEQFSGDSVFAWDAPAGRIVYYLWGSTGSHGRHEAYYAGDELVFPVARKDDPSATAYRSVWRRLDPDAFEVRREVPDGDAWKTELTVVYRRADAAK